MRLGGWAFLFFSWGLIIAMLIFCFHKIFANKNKEKK